MKIRKVIFLITLSVIGYISVNAISKGFELDLNEFKNEPQIYDKSIKDVFGYNLNYSISSENEKLKEEISYLSRKVTYLLLGDNAQETNEEYYNRHKDYLSLRYNPVVPKDSSTSSGLDEKSQEYQDDLVSGLSIPGMFIKMDDLDVKYDKIDSIRVSINDNMIISVVSLPNVELKQINYDNQMEYKVVRANLILYYYFKKLNDEYKLYYLFGETNDEVNDYLDNIENSELAKSFSVSDDYKSQLSDIFDYSKLNAVDQNSLSKIYDNNISNIVSLNSYFNNEIVASSNGFIILNGLVVTTWDFLDKSLNSGQFISIKNSNGDNYEIDGIVTINPSSNIAVLKLKENIPSTIKVGNSKSIKVEDIVLSINSKSGVGFNLQKGIVTSIDEYIQSSIPLTKREEGSPLFNELGEVIGINTAKSTSTSISYAIFSEALREIYDKFQNFEHAEIESIPFEKLKEKYYYFNSKEEDYINKISKKKWNEFSKIGDIENTIKLNLVKANVDNDTVSLRYYNAISKYISSMQLSVQFTEKLISDGYKEELNSSAKKIYSNNKYRVILMEEFDYLIIVMVRL